MSVEESNTMSWFFRPFKSKNEPGLKGKTIKKSAPKAQDSNGLSVGNELASRSKDTDNDFPSEYYTPRPVPKSFVVGEVRKVSNNGSPLNYPGARAKEAEPKVTTSASTAATELPNSQHGESSCLQTLSPRSTSSDFKIGSPQEQLTISTQKLMPNGTNGEHRPQSIFHLLLGQQDPSSLYFTRRYFNLPDLDYANNALESRNDTLHRIYELDPQAFEIYKIYMHIGKISFRCPENVKTEHIWIACWPLINAHILGCVIEEPGFADRVMDTLTENLAPGVCPDIETIEHLFDGKNGVPALLQQFVVDRFVDTQQRSHVLLETPNLPTNFRLLLLQAAMQRLSNGSVVESNMGCQYHIHGTDEACYRSQITLQSMSKDKKLAEAREISARDAQVAVANAEQNGVKSVDWEKRRLDVNRTLRAESGRTWVGFRKLEGGKVVENLDAFQQGKNSIDDGELDRNRSGPMRESHETTSALMNGSNPTFDLNRTPNNPLPRQGELPEKIPVGEPHLHIHTNGLPNGKHAASAKKAMNADTLEPVELQGSTTYDVPHPLSMLPGYKRGTNRVSGLRDQSLQTSVMVNNTHDTGTRSPTTRESLQEGEFAYGKALSIHGHAMVCPGAYPESIVGV